MWDRCQKKVSHERKVLGGANIVQWKFGHQWVGWTAVTDNCD